MKSLLFFWLFVSLVLVAKAKEADDYDHSLDRELLLSTLDSMTSSKDPSSEYRIGDKLGSGKWGVVFECTEKSTGEKFAIKKLGTDRTKNIVYAINELTLGPWIHIVNKELHPFAESDVLGYGKAYHYKGFFWLVMELVPNGMTASQAARGSKLTFSLFETLMVKSLSMLDMLESYSICHQDFSASNVMILSDNRERFVLLDFGRSLMMRQKPAKRSKDDYRYLESDHVCSDRTKILTMAKTVHTLIKPSPRSAQKSRIKTLLKNLEAMQRNEKSAYEVLLSFQSEPKTEL